MVTVIQDVTLDSSGIVTGLSSANLDVDITTENRIRYFIYKKIRTRYYIWSTKVTSFGNLEMAILL